MGLKERLLALAAGDGNSGNTAENIHVTEKAVSNQSSNTGDAGNTGSRECLGETGTAGAPDRENLTHVPLLSRVTRVTGVTSLKTREESGNTAGESRVAGVTDDEGLEWQGEADDVAPPPEPQLSHRGGPNPPAEGSLVARLCAAGATVRSYGSEASIVAPAGIPVELLAEVERRGWRIIPGGKPNAEAEHDSWAFGGVGIRELD